MTLKSPFPYFGGKSKIAHEVWSRFGDTANYVEPFCGSAAVLLARPSSPRIETVNDANCFIANFWRAIQAEPEATAAHADWPVNEADLHARHRWLMLSESSAAWRERMKTDPEFYDPKVAGWWVWGASCWIGAGWCDGGRLFGRDGAASNKKPETRVRRGDSTALTQKLPSRSTAGAGVHQPGLDQKRPSVTTSGRGVAAAGLEKKRPRLTGWAGAGVHRQLPDLAGNAGAAGRGLHASGFASRKIPDVGKSRRGDATVIGLEADRRRPGNGRGVTAATAILEWFEQLADRLRRVRVVCGDWRRVTTPAVTTGIGVTGVFLDPPYSRLAGRTPGIYSEDDGEVAHQAREWAIQHGEDASLRIALCGYEGERPAGELGLCRVAGAGRLCQSEEERDRVREPAARAGMVQSALPGGDAAEAHRMRFIYLTSGRAKTESAPAPRGGGRAGASAAGSRSRLDTSLPLCAAPRRGARLPGAACGRPEPGRRGALSQHVCRMCRADEIVAVSGRHDPALTQGAVGLPGHVSGIAVRMLALAVPAGAARARMIVVLQHGHLGLGGARAGERDMMPRMQARCVVQQALYRAGEARRGLGMGLDTVGHAPEPERGSAVALGRHGLCAAGEMGHGSARLARDHAGLRRQPTGHRAQYCLRRVAAGDATYLGLVDRVAARGYHSQRFARPLRGHVPDSRRHDAAPVFLGWEVADGHGSGEGAVVGVVGPQLIPARGVPLDDVIVRVRMASVEPVTLPARGLNGVVAGRGKTILIWRFISIHYRVFVFCLHRRLHFHAYCRALRLRAIPPGLPATHQRAGSRGGLVALAHVVHVHGEPDVVAAPGGAGVDASADLDHTGHDRATALGGCERPLSYGRYGAVRVAEVGGDLLGRHLPSPLPYSPGLGVLRYAA